MSAQTFYSEGCVHFEDEYLTRGEHHQLHRLPQPKDNWDPSRIYPVAVILVSFSDKDFSVGNPEVPASLGDISNINDRYRLLFNEPGFNRGVGPGCVAEYFQKQSNGLFNPRFDIYGPVQINSSFKSGEKYGKEALRQATTLLIDSVQFDASIYDWDGDGYAESFIYIYAGYGSNEINAKTENCIWPNTSSFSNVTAGNTKINLYSASAELWASIDRSCGIGSICHEYCHTLGLPDIYPSRNDSVFSVCDEWDLMDGGNFVNNGWCPPALSAHEKMLLGWLTPEVLDSPISITNLQSVEEGGKAYLIPTESSTEFFLLENRQWVGWDSRTPGHGLLISHVDYNSSAWSSNNVNNNPDHYRYEFVHADNMDYNMWKERGTRRKNGHSTILSSTPYPFVSDTVSNNSFTDLSTPPSTVYIGETGFLSKPLTQIYELENGLVSFRFMLDDPYHMNYMLTYLVDGEVYKTYEIEYGTTITPEAEPTKEGCNFSGWSEIPETMPAEDIFIYGSYTTGINSINTDSSKAHIYNMQGNRLDKPQKGLNIIRIKDRKTKMVIK